jgi:hypothetical protein
MHYSLLLLVFCSLLFAENHAPAPTNEKSPHGRLDNARRQIQTQRQDSTPAEISRLSRKEVIAEVVAPGFAFDNDQINLLFLQLQRRRLQDEIAVLEKPSVDEGKASWISHSRRMILETKKRSLESIERVWKRVAMKEGPKEPFDSLLDMQKFDQPPTGATTLPGLGGADVISKKASGAGWEPGPPIGSPSGPQLEFDGLADIKKRMNAAVEEENFQRDMNKLLSTPIKSPRLDGALPDWVKALKAAPQIDVNASAEVDSFLNKLGVDKTLEKREADLSAQFPPPSLQGKTFGCVGHAVAVNASAAHRGVDAISGTDTYSVLTAGRGDDVPIESVTRALGSLRGKPIRSNTGRVFSIQEFESVQSRPSAAALRKMVSGGQPPIVEIGTDARTYVENHIVPKPGNVRHVLNVVGYGRGLDPQTGAEQDYFTVMDSFAPGKSTYKIAASDLLSHAKALYRITKVTPLR